jgi:protein-L-isoaspartate O-methyltransferase
VGPVGRVVSLDKNKYNQDSAIETIGIHYPHLLRRIEFHEKNVFEGFPEAAPYDAIHVGAAVFSVFLFY